MEVACLRPDKDERYQSSWRRRAAWPRVAAETADTARAPL